VLLNGDAMKALPERFREPKFPFEARVFPESSDAIGPRFLQQKAADIPRTTGCSLMVAEDPLAQTGLHPGPIDCLQEVPK